jgi:Ricin-type beta-trefoil lectin domain-like
LAMSETPNAAIRNDVIYNSLWASVDWPAALTTNQTYVRGRLNLENFVRKLPSWVAPTDIQSGVYKLINVNSNKCVEVGGSNTGNGSGINQWSCYTGANQEWRIESLGSGLYKLKAMHSGRVMGVGASSMVDRAKVVQWDDVGVADQKWRIEAYGSGYRLIASHSGKCLDLFNFAANDGFQLEQNICNNGTAQQFKLKALF